MGMALASVFMTTTGTDSPLDGSKGTDEKSGISDFLTVQSLANFGAVTGAITMAWGALRTINAALFSSTLVPLTFAMLFAVVSIAISRDGLKKDGKFDWGNALAAIFVAVINALVLTSAVMGATAATS
jgi:hypothetical protein